MPDFALGVREPTIEGMGGSIKTFRHVRARVRRNSEGTWHGGWTIQLGHEAAQVRLHELADLGTNETVEVVCDGDGTRGAFSGAVVAQSGPDVLVRVEGTIHFSPGLEAVRYPAEGLLGALGSGRPSTGFAPLDLSSHGLGGLCDGAFPVGSRLTLVLRTPGGPFTGEVGVANCRPDPAGTGHFRVGLSLLGASRFDMALWHRIVRERAEG